ncbi:MAG: alpha/beta fold hydrolase, partial [Caulobacteraceae bacterium]
MTDAAPLDEAPPTPPHPQMSPEMAAPLASFAGARPPTPAWFEAALAAAPERTRVPVLGAEIELLTWGEVGKPGLIFVHGNSANADWWSFIAPFFAADWRVAALSLSGMGASDWRERYGFETFAAEIDACARAAGLNEAPGRPVYIGHSFGGAIVHYCAHRHPERMRAAILVDTGFGGPPTPEQAARWEAEARARGEAAGRWRGPPRSGRPTKVYPSLASA